MQFSLHFIGIGLQLQNVRGPTIQVSSQPLQSQYEHTPQKVHVDSDYLQPF